MAGPLIDKIWEEGRKRPAGDWCTLEAWARRAPPVTPTTLPELRGGRPPRNSHSDERELRGGQGWPTRKRCSPEGYIKNSVSDFEMMELEVEPNPATSAQVSVEQTPRRHVQCLAADALDSDSSELLFEAVSASSVSDKMKRAGISLTPSPSSNSGSAIPRCKQTPTSNSGSPTPRGLRSPSMSPQWNVDLDSSEFSDDEHSKTETEQCRNAAEDIYS